MKYIYYQNPLRTKVILDEQEKEIFRLRCEREGLKAKDYLPYLEGYHMGDCTCVPASCPKCYAESLLGVDTIEGLGKYEAGKIHDVFCPHNDFDERTIDEVLEELMFYEPVYHKFWDDYGGKETFDKYVPIWKEEATRAYNWLLNYKLEHGF